MNKLGLKLWYLILLIAAVPANPALTGPLEDIQSLQTGQWYEIPNSHLSDVVPNPTPPGNTGPRSIISAWSGGAYDTKNNRLLIWGGGHADYSGNEVYAFDMDTLTWERIWGPTPIDLIPNAVEAYQAYPDGSPSSRHTYNHLAYVPAPYNLLYNHGGSVWREPSMGLPYQTTWFLNLDTLTWSDTGELANNPGGGSAVYDAVTKTIYTRSKYGIFQYNIDAVTWSKVYHYGAGWWDHPSGDLDPTNRIIGYLGNCKIGVFDLGANSYTEYSETDFSGFTEIVCATEPGFVHDPNLGKFVAWHGDSANSINPEDVYVIDLIERTIEKRTPAPTNIVIPSQAARWGTYGRFRYVPTLNVYVVVNSIDENVYVYRLSSSSCPDEQCDPGETCAADGCCDGQPYDPQTQICCAGTIYTGDCCGSDDCSGDRTCNTQTHLCEDLTDETYGMAELRTDATVYSISLEWDITGDRDKDAVCDVQYREGTNSWNDALDLMRVDFEAAVTKNMMAGSIMFLQPGTTYEVKLDYSDPDGGAWTRTAYVQTQALPTKPISTNAYYVEPGAGGGDGSIENPFKGIDAALAVAQPGSTFLLNGGDYGGRVSFDVSGSPGNYIVWQAASDTPVIFSAIEAKGSYNWFEGLTINIDGDNCPGISTYGDSASNTPHHIVITKNTVAGGGACTKTPCREYLIRGKIHAKYWHITDNTITGDVAVGTDTMCGEGIDMGHHNAQQTGHVIAHNQISLVADGISYTGGNVDLFGNDIFDVADDGIEPDYASANVRVWGNRITNAQHNAISLQDFENGMPWYIIKNQIISYQQNVLKANSPPGYYAFYHNTVVNWDHIFFDYNSEMTLYGTGKNNIMVTMVPPEPSYGRHFWAFKNAIPDWRSDFDHNAYDFEQNLTPFYYQGITYAGLDSYRSASGFDMNSIEIEKESCFENIDYSGPSPIQVPFQHLSLKTGCAAIDRGVVLPNINDDYLGSSPDMGAYESGAELPHYGPRDVQPNDDTPQPDESDNGSGGSGCFITQSQS